jgi:hypothetical protein
MAPARVVPAAGKPIACGRNPAARHGRSCELRLNGWPGRGCVLGRCQARPRTITPTAANTASSGWNPIHASSAASKQTSPAPAAIDSSRACRWPRNCHHPASRKPPPTSPASSTPGIRQSLNGVPVSTAGSARSSHPSGAAASSTPPARPAIPVTNSRLTSARWPPPGPRKADGRTAWRRPSARAALLTPSCCSVVMALARVGSPTWGPHPHAARGFVVIVTGGMREAPARTNDPRQRPDRPGRKAYAPFLPPSCHIRR